MRAGFGVGTALLLPNLPGSIPFGRASPAHDHEPADDDRGSKNFKPGAAFVEPEVRSSANGELNTTLRMQYAYKNIGGYRLYVRTYEGAVPGPTLRLKPGDVLHIKLINDMPPNRDPEPIKSG
jgi:FtsP/CotA-like multicopper oxidase with cupredoxin domain